MKRDFIAVIVVAILMCGLLYSINLVSSNSFPGINSRNFVGKFSPSLNNIPFTLPTLYKDGSIVFSYHLLRINSVQTKYFLFKKYVTLSLSERIGTGFSDKPVSIDLPANLLSSGVKVLTPSDLMAGQQIAFNTTYRTRAESETFFDVKSWEITYLK